MYAIPWILLGVLTGVFTSRIVRRDGPALLPDIGLGILGALLGAFVFNVVAGEGRHGLSGFHYWSLPVAALGAVGLLTAYHALRRTGHG